MPPGNLSYGGGVQTTVLNPVIGIVLLVSGLLILFLPRNKVLIPCLVTCIIIPMDQVIVFAGLHFPTLRVVILFGMIRVLMVKLRGESEVFSGGINKIDIAVILLAISRVIAGAILFRNVDAVIYQLGELYTVFCTYFLLRCFIRDRDDVLRVVRVFAWITVVLAIVMTYERTTGTNLYANLGGARAAFYSSVWVREGKVRATGPFGVPILAGTFGCVLLPLFIGLWLSERKQRMIAMLGLVAATVMTITCNSSGPLLAYLAALVALCLWPFRGAMRIIRWGIVVTLVSLHMVMKAPVWALIGRFDITGGGSGDHRYMLVDNFIRRFGEWWLVGTDSYSQWGWVMWDLANQYVAVGQKSGLLSFLLFISIIVFGFKYLGNARRAAKDKKEALFLWAMGSALFAHVVSFFGIAYWDQTIVAWYALLAMICAVAVPQRLKATLPQFHPDMEPTVVSSPVPLRF